MPGFTFPKVGPLGLGSPPSRTGNQFVGTMFRYDCQQPFSGSFAFARPPIPCILLFGSCPVFFFGSPGGLEYPCQRLGSCLSSVPLLLTYGKEPADCEQSDALPSSRVAPVSTCPVLRPRWCPTHSPYRIQDCCLPPLAKRRLSPACASLSADHDYTHFEAQ